VIDLVEAAGLALYDEEPERIAGLFDQAIAGFSIHIGRPWTCGKRGQRRLEPPSKSRQRRCALLGHLVGERCISGTK